MTPSGDDQGAGKDNPVQKIPDFLSSLLLSHHVLKSISVFGKTPILFIVSPLDYNEPKFLVISA